MLDITHIHETKEGLLKTFIKNCDKLPPNGKLSIFNYPNCVIVYKDEEYEHLFDVYHRVNGQIVEQHDTHGVYIDELYSIVQNFLFDKVNNSPLRA